MFWVPYKEGFIDTSNKTWIWYQIWLVGYQIPNFKNILIIFLDKELLSNVFGNCGKKNKFNLYSKILKVINQVYCKF